MVGPNPHRALIIDLFKEGVSAIDIIKRLGLPRTTVYAAISRFEQLGTFLDRCGRGRRPSVVTPALIMAVKESIKGNPHRSIRQLAVDMKISRTSMSKIVKDELKFKSHVGTLMAPRGRPSKSSEPATGVAKTSPKAMPPKRGRGRPPKANKKSDGEKAAKIPKVDAAPGAKRGRGRPPKKAAAAAATKPSKKAEPEAETTSDSGEEKNEEAEE